MRIEMEALEKNVTWEIVDLPQNKRAMRCNLLSVYYQIQVKRIPREIQGKVSCQRHTNLLGGLLENICTSCKDEHSENPIVLGYEL